MNYYRYFALYTNWEGHLLGTLRTELEHLNIAIYSNFYNQTFAKVVVDSCDIPHCLPFLRLADLTSFKLGKWYLNRSVSDLKFAPTKADIDPAKYLVTNKQFCFLCAFDSTFTSYWVSKCQNRKPGTKRIYELEANKIK